MIVTVMEWSGYNSLVDMVYIYDEFINQGKGEEEFKGTCTGAYAGFYKGRLQQRGYIILNDTGGQIRAGGGGGGVPLAFRQIYERETLASRFKVSPMVPFNLSFATGYLFTLRTY